MSQEESNSYGGETTADTARRQSWSLCLVNQSTIAEFYLWDITPYILLEVNWQTGPGETGCEASSFWEELHLLPFSCWFLAWPIFNSEDWCEISSETSAIFQRTILCISHKTGLLISTAVRTPNPGAENCQLSIIPASLEPNALLHVLIRCSTYGWRSLPFLSFSFSLFLFCFILLFSLASSILPFILRCRPLLKSSPRH